MRFLLDTSALSEPSKRDPDPGYLARIRKHGEEACTCAPVLHELVFGIARLPPSALRNRLEDYVSAMLGSGLVVLPYNDEAARWHAHERARLTGAGRTPPFVDGQIAAIAATQGLSLVTRNVAAFTGFVGLRVVTWWRASKRMSRPAKKRSAIP